MPMNSRDKGCRGERELANKVKEIVNELKEDKGIDITNMFK